MIWMAFQRKKICCLTGAFRNNFCRRLIFLVQYDCKMCVCNLVVLHPPFQKVVMLQKIKRKEVHVCLLVVGPRLTYLLVSHIHIYIYIYTHATVAATEKIKRLSLDCLLWFDLSSADMFFGLDGFPIVFYFRHTMGSRRRLKAMLDLHDVQTCDGYFGIFIQVDYSTQTKPDRWWSLPRDRTNAILNQLKDHTSHSLTVNYRWIYPSPDGNGEDAPWEWTSYYSLDFESMIQQNVETGNVRRFRVMLAL